MKDGHCKHVVLGHILGDSPTKVRKLSQNASATIDSRATLTMLLKPENRDPIPVDAISPMFYLVLNVDHP